jgi:hypothetical protein
MTRRRLISLTERVCSRAYGVRSMCSLRFVFFSQCPVFVPCTEILFRTEHLGEM